MKCTKILLFLLIVGHVGQVCGQSSVYKTSRALDGSLIGIGAAALGTSLVLQKNHPVLTAADIENLSPEAIPKFDRWAINNWDPKSHRASNVVLFSSYALPLTFLLDTRGRDEFGKIGLQSLEALLLNNGIGNITKHLTKRVRPYVYNPDVPLSAKTQANSNLSFFSGHTSNVACMYFFTAKIFSDLYPDSNARPYVWSTAIIVPALQGLLRVKAGKHFPTDVIAGYLVGAAVGILVPALHR